MKSIFLTTAAIVGSLSQMAPAASQTEILRNRCAEQERQIKSLEKEIDSMHALLAKNNLRPTKRSIAAATPKSSGGSYTIRKGDSLSKIARNNGISLNALMAANKGINPNRLQIGQKIALPGNSSQTVTKTTATQTSKPNLGNLPAPIKPGQGSVAATTAATATTSYTIQAKDTLYQIAKNHNTSVANILELNNGLSPSKLRIGQTIQIAGNPKAPAATSAKATPAKPVAQKSQPKPAATPATAKKEEVKAPVAKAAPAPKQETSTTQPEAAPKVRTVSVTRQMTFGDFASEYGASVEQLNEMNNLRLSKKTVLAQGSELYIPNNKH